MEPGIINTSTEFVADFQISQKKNVLNGTLFEKQPIFSVLARV
jgi:hypothetical protein